MCVCVCVCDERSQSHHHMHLPIALQAPALTCVYVCVCVCACVCVCVCSIYWDMEQYSACEKIFRQSADFCSEHSTWKLNVAHTYFMQENHYKEAIRCCHTSMYTNTHAYLPRRPHVPYTRSWSLPYAEK
jgi:hypothetical protein